ncbi:nucleoside diphosphate-linked moiety X motif 17 isoform X2 [Chelmon rostratus]|uniref:nucleoside diphosphate-linked moiety X motif 17 isoform X2 n=1 Tax=Chelmon rostratus TaxID=109905 RepID=UPI001BEA0DB6|nr:nucleoside diphosphate-linked moiety X motif 17 isoform X2 [Chelmon rostratus]
MSDYVEFSIRRILFPSLLTATTQSALKLDTRWRSALRSAGRMDKVRRILVHVCKERAAPRRAQFVQSVTGHFSDGGADEVEVSCSLEKNQFVLYRGDKGRGTPLKRPAFCPIKHLSVTEAAAIPLDVQERGIDVGVAIILQTANQRVLLTRRAKELRIFPNVWVPPGGHVEPDETLLDAGLRELKEETGLKLEPEDVSPQMLGLWEASLSPSAAEVSACLWADRRLVRAIVSAVDGEDAGLRLDDLPSGVSVSEVSSGGALTDSTLPVTVFVSRVPLSGPDVERVSTGTKFALELWLKSLKSLKSLETLTPDP